MKREKGTLASANARFELKVASCDVHLNQLGLSFRIDQELPGLVSQEGLHIPLNVFCTGLGVLEATCLFLKDDLQFSHTKMAKALGRSVKTVFTSYSEGKRKKRRAVKAAIPDILVPLEVFRDPELGPLESLSGYLHSFYSVREIAAMLGKNVQTIYTSLRRSKLKKTGGGSAG